VGRRLPRSFFRRSSLLVAPALLGTDVVRVLPDGTPLRARIVETEAYEPDDPASHAFRGPTARNTVMFGPPGHLYVYLAYGVHHCMNIVCGTEGVASAVLLRAAEPLEGLEAMQRRRGAVPPRDLCRGPGRWTQAFAVDRALDGTDVAGGQDLWLERAVAVSPQRIVAGPRIGITSAADRPWRFCVAESRFLSRPEGALSRPRSSAASRPSR